MMKYLWTVLFICLFAVSDAFCAGYDFGSPAQGLTLGVADNIRNAWGYPTWSEGYIQDRNAGPGNFKLKEGWACCGANSSQIESIYLNKTIMSGSDDTIESKLISTKDDKSFMAFTAKYIYEHGGYFCLTQFFAASSTSQFFLRRQQPNWPGMKCMTLCEPGWDGPYCQSKTSEDSPCDPTDIAAAINVVKRYKYKGNDALSPQLWRIPVEHDYFIGGFVRAFYPHFIILGASDFEQHGIVAQPVLVATTGMHPTVTQVTHGPAGGKIKKLCAQGFTKNDKCEISSKNCGSNVWCNGYSDSNMKSNIHEKQKSGYCNVIVCKDGTKALDAGFNCVDYDGIKDGRCEKPNSESFGRYVSCGVGKVYDAETCECVNARSVSLEVMQYGPSGKNADVDKQCWTKESADDFVNCVLGIVPVKTTEEEEKK